MAIEALTRLADGQVLTPTTDENWQDWVSASNTRNHVLNDPLLDWLDLHGEPNDFIKDSDRDEYDPRLDFSSFIMAKGNQFEDVFVAWLDDVVGVVNIGDYKVARSLEAADQAVAEMVNGTNRQPKKPRARFGRGSGVNVP